MQYVRNLRDRWDLKDDGSQPTILLTQMWITQPFPKNKRNIYHGPGIIAFIFDNGLSLAQ